MWCTTPAAIGGGRLRRALRRSLLPPLVVKPWARCRRAALPPAQQLKPVRHTPRSGSREIRQLVLSAQVNPEFAFINAAALAGLLPLRLAAHKALTYAARGRLVSKTLHSELVYNLSGSKHVRSCAQQRALHPPAQCCAARVRWSAAIAHLSAANTPCAQSLLLQTPCTACLRAHTRTQIGESLKRFGVQDDTQHLLVARFDAAPEDVRGGAARCCCTCCPPPALCGQLQQRMHQA